MAPLSEPEHSDFWGRSARTVTKGAQVYCLRNCRSHASTNRLATRHSLRASAWFTTPVVSRCVAIRCAKVGKAERLAHIPWREDGYRRLSIKGHYRKCGRGRNKPDLNPIWSQAYVPVYLPPAGPYIWNSTSTSSGQLDVLCDSLATAKVTQIPETHDTKGYLNGR
jgi:hypothetical protein